MEFKCKGVWHSWVGVTFPPPRPENDGVQTIGDEAVNGKFDGHHKRPKTETEFDEFDLTGFCEEVTGSHRIRFITTEGFAYRGTITPKHFEGRTRDVAEGKRVRTGIGGEVVAEEDWVAVKVSQ